MKVFLNHYDRSTSVSSEGTPYRIQDTDDKRAPLEERELVL
jgi:hypothetical protein